jgi:hypothetical protein
MSNPRRKLQGDESLYGNGLELPRADVLAFWRWAFGDLCHNNLRGVFAEWLVAQLLGIDLPETRDPWAAHDLEWRDRLTIEVKCCASFQSWHTEGQAPSRLEWNVPKTRTWTVQDGYAENPSHNADLYVLCMQIEENAARWDPLDLDQWRFYVLTREQLAALGAARISRRRLGQAAREVTAGDLLAEVMRLAESGTTSASMRRKHVDAS